MIRFVFLVGILFTFLWSDDVALKYEHYLQTLPTKTKKYRFFKLLLPPIKQVDKELRALYMQTIHDLQTQTHKERIKKLKKAYKAKDELDLLKRIKPHPLSITLAQAAIESAWGTSRFFVEANNVFGMWSKGKNEKTTIEAKSTRGGTKHIYLQRYKTLTDSVRAYYKNIATNPAYRCFREVRYYSDDPYEIVALLHRYSEKKELYPVELIKIIKHNNLIRFDAKKPLPRYKQYQ